MILGPLPSPAPISRDALTSLEILLGHTPAGARAIVPREALASMIAELRRHRAAELTRGEASVLRWAATRALAQVTLADDEWTDLGEAIAKVTLAEITGVR